MRLKKPVLFVNFKTYEQATGKNAVKLAKQAEVVAVECGASIALVVQAVDIYSVSEAVSLPVFAQHIDPVGFGSNTGRVLPKAVKQAGAVGTVLNHAENKQSNQFIEKVIARAGQAGLDVMVCAGTTARAKEIASLKHKPGLIAVEPPELIGGNTSVSTANPWLITGSVKAVKNIAPKIGVITGAGVKDVKDVAKALELGSVGVFVASGIIKAKSPKKAMEGLVAGFKQGGV